MKLITHIAGRYIDRVQQCTRCMTILLNRRGDAMMQPGKDWPAFAEGSHVLETDKGFGLMSHSDSVTCEPML